MINSIDSSNLRKAEIISVIHTQCLEGQGTPDNTFRIVNSYYSIEGVLLARSDPQDEMDKEKEKR